MEITEKKAYVEQVLHYLEKDWEWSPILLGMLHQDGLSEKSLEEIALMFDKAIRECEDDAKRKKLENAFALIKNFQKEEQKYANNDKKEASKLFNTII